MRTLLPLAGFPPEMVYGERVHEDRWPGSVLRRWLPGWLRRDRVVSLAAMLVGGSLAAGLPTAAQFDLEDLEFVEVTRGIDGTTSIAHAGDGSGRLFLTEQAGTIRIHDGHALVATPFLDIRDRVAAGGERGLLSVAFHPEYALNGRFFVYYTDLGGNTVVSQFQVTADPNTADAGSEAVYFRATQPWRNHNGGQLQFGPDGYLYIGLGDGGRAGDPLDAGQDLGSPLGKLLRVDVDRGAPAIAAPSNPFVSTPGALAEIWAYGLRNPWRFSFDRLTGDLFIADVGQNAAEEISFQPAASTGGENYGWRLMEGSLCFRPTSGCNDGSLVLPILEYGHLEGNCGASVTGGYRYRGDMFPEMSGLYFFADYCTGNFYGGQEGESGWTIVGPRQTSFQIRTFGEDEQGEVYFAGPSVLYRLEVSRPPPQVSSLGAVNAATLEAGAGLAPGSLATVFGTGLALRTAAARGSQLPFGLGGGSVVFGSTHVAPQVFASPGQRNFQVPWELAGLSSASLTVRVGDVASPAVPVALVDVAPGVFTLGGSDQAFALVGSTGLLAGPSGPSAGARPAVAGESVHIFATGLGPVTNGPATGFPALSVPASEVEADVLAEVGGASAPVVFAGLAPGFAGLYLVTIEVPAAAPSGRAVAVVVRVGGRPSNTARIAVATRVPAPPGNP